MTVLQSVILGLIQGVTEFLPISSSGHLVIAQQFLNVDLPKESLLHFDVMLHGATLLAIILFYATMWWRILKGVFLRDKEAWSIAIKLIIATIPAAFAGYYLADKAEALQSITLVAWSMIITGVYLVITEHIGRISPNENVMPRYLGALWIGIWQVIALTPGISRAGMTIGAGRMLQLSRQASVDFAFLMAAPIIAGATLVSYESVTSGNIPFPDPAVVVTGFLAALAASLGAMYFLRRFVRNYSLGWFAIYLLPVGAALLLTS